jgi:hypothetical protein
MIPVVLESSVYPVRTIVKKSEAGFNSEYGKLLSKIQFLKIAVRYYCYTTIGYF